MLSTCRIDAEVSTLNKQLDEIKAVKDASGDHETISEETAASIEVNQIGAIFFPFVAPSTVFY